MLNRIAIFSITHCCIPKHSTVFLVTHLEFHCSTPRRHRPRTLHSKPSPRFTTSNQTIFGVVHDEFRSLRHTKQLSAVFQEGRIRAVQVGAVVGPGPGFRLDRSTILLAHEHSDQTLEKQVSGVVPPHLYVACTKTRAQVGKGLSRRQKNVFFVTAIGLPIVAVSYFLAHECRSRKPRPGIFPFSPHVAIKAACSYLVLAAALPPPAPFFTSIPDIRRRFPHGKCPSKNAPRITPTGLRTP